MYRNGTPTIQFVELVRKPEKCSIERERGGGERERGSVNMVVGEREYKEKEKQKTHIVGKLHID